MRNYLHRWFLRRRIQSRRRQIGDLNEYADVVDDQYVRDQIQTRISDLQISNLFDLKRFHRIRGQ